MLIISLYQKDKDKYNENDNDNADNGDDKDHSQRASKPSRAAEAMAAGRGDTVKLLREYFLLVFSSKIIISEVAANKEGNMSLCALEKI